MNKKEMIDVIDSKLDVLLKKMTLTDYRYMIKSTSLLRKYDYIVGRIDIGRFPKLALIFITKNELNELSNFLDDKIKEI